MSDTDELARRVLAYLDAAERTAASARVLVRRATVATTILAGLGLFGVAAVALNDALRCVPCPEAHPLVVGPGVGSVLLVGVAVWLGRRGW